MYLERELFHEAQYEGDGHVPVGDKVCGIEHQKEVQTKRYFSCKFLLLQPKFAHEN